MGKKLIHSKRHTIKMENVNYVSKGKYPKYIRNPYNSMAK